MLHAAQRLDQLTVLPGQQALTRAQLAREGFAAQQGAQLGDLARDDMVSAATSMNVARAGLGATDSGQSSQLPLKHIKHIQDFTEQTMGELLPGRQAVKEMASRYEIDPTQITAEQLAGLIGMA